MRKGIVFDFDGVIINSSEIQKQAEYFEAVVCSDDVKNPKPDPDSLILAINNLAVSFDSADMVGNTRNDIICAKRAGVKIIAVNWGDVPKKILEREYPDYMVNTVEELLKVIVCLAEDNEACVST